MDAIVGLNLCLLLYFNASGCMHRKRLQSGTTKTTLKSVLKLQQTANEKKLNCFELYPVVC